LLCFVAVDLLEVTKVVGKILLMSTLVAREVRAPVPKATTTSAVVNQECNTDEIVEECSRDNDGRIRKIQYIKGKFLGKVSNVQRGEIAMIFSS
jgi:hypothetical protein